MEVCVPETDDDAGPTANTNSPNSAGPEPHCSRLIIVARSKAGSGRTMGRRQGRSGLEGRVGDMGIGHRYRAGHHQGMSLYQTSLALR